MAGNIFWRILVSPFVLLYGIGVSFRNFLYNKQILKSVRFNHPVIGVGNLSVGGSGKTPHIEYLIQLLRPHFPVGTLSRGYKRKTTGYRDVSPTDKTPDVGDEPLQMKRKYRDVAVAVSENRALGVPRLLQKNPNVRVVLLDDIFQHRAVTPGLNILLTTYEEPFWNDYLLPAGRLREWRSAYKRANAIIITKCPPDLSVKEADNIRSRFKDTKLPVFFTTFSYGQPYFLFDGTVRADVNDEMDVVVFTGIANSSYLKSHLEDQANRIYSLEFGDHHHFTKYDIAQLSKLYKNLESENKIIVTTEKDAVRLDEHIKYINESRLPIFIIQVQVSFLFNEKEKFDEYVKNFLLDFKV